MSSNVTFFCSFICLFVCLIIIIYLCKLQRVRFPHLFVCLSEHGAKVRYISNISKPNWIFFYFHNAKFMKRFDLHRFRTEKKITQKELADFFGCNQNFISRIENGIRTLPQEKMSLLQSKFGIFPLIMRNCQREMERMRRAIACRRKNGRMILAWRLSE